MTVQNCGGDRNSGPLLWAKYKKNQIEHGWGNGDSVRCSLQGQALVTASYQHPPKDTDCKNPRSLRLTHKNKISCFHWVQLQMIAGGAGTVKKETDGNSQIKTGRKKAEWETQERGPGTTRGIKTIIRDS